MARCLHYCDEVDFSRYEPGITVPELIASLEFDRTKCDAHLRAAIWVALEHGADINELFKRMVEESDKLNG